MNTATLNSFRDYVTLKLHFNSEGFNWTDGAGKKIGVEALQKRKDRAFFDRLNQKHPDTEDRREYLISGFLYNPNLWIGEFLEKEVVNFHRKRLVRLKSIEHLFASEVESIHDYMLETKTSIRNLLKLTDGDRPAIIADRSKILGGVSDETLALIDKAFNFTKQDTNNPLWSQERLKLRKYKWFLSVPRDTMLYHFNLLATGPTSQS